MNPRYPVYVPTKGRFDSLLTIKALERIKVPYRAVVEPQEVDSYAAVMDQEKILVLPHRDKGLVVTRNWIWDHAQAAGVKRFWTFDDNIRCFYRINYNQKALLCDGTAFYVMEEFVERYQNVPIAGMQYEFFVPRKEKVPPYYLNTRVYSNMLIETEARDCSGKAFRNEGFYNDDTDLCLRVLKSGFCTVLFNAFLIKKMPTMKVKGGMTPHYQANQEGASGMEADGRYRMAKELQEKHPDVVQITRKWGRWQHQVNYVPFARNELKLCEGVNILEGINEYGMELQVDNITERELMVEHKTKRLNLSRTDFLNTAVQQGKSVDEAAAEWREYVAKSLETNSLAAIENSSK